MNMKVLPSRLAVIQLEPFDDMPLWIHNSKDFLTITYTDEELSIVCSEDVVPGDFNGTIENDWCCLKVEEKLDLAQTGILSALTGPLAGKEIPVFTVSTYNTDYLLVKAETLEETLSILNEEGHTIIQ